MRKRVRDASPPARTAAKILARRALPRARRPMPSSSHRAPSTFGRIGGDAQARRASVTKRANAREPVPWCGPYWRVLPTAERADAAADVERMGSGSGAGPYLLMKQLKGAHGRRRTVCPRRRRPQDLHPPSPCRSQQEPGGGVLCGAGHRRQPVPVGDLHHRTGRHALVRRPAAECAPPPPHRWARVALARSRAVVRSMRAARAASSTPDWTSRKTTRTVRPRSD